MEEIVKHINDTNASYRTPNAGDAKNTDLFLDNEHYELFKDSGDQIVVRFNKENLSKAILFIASILPRKYDNSAAHKTIAYTPEFVYNQLSILDYFFRVDGNPVMYKTQTWNPRKDILKKNGEIDNRFYFNGLLEDVPYVNFKGEHTSAKFTIRNYVAGGYSDLHIKKGKDGIYDVWVTNVLQPYNDDQENGLEVLDTTRPLSLPLQTIYYGAPGTGKSHEVKIQTGELDALGNEQEKLNVFRTTFHPDTDYAAFVGCYKPTMKPVAEKYRAVAGKEEEIVYEFVPQAFTDAYIYAYNHTDEQTYLVIEEINRGNCAQIFGDLFQLLDRKADGTSEYTIKADKDLANYLTAQLGEDSDGIKDGKLRLPANLNILATMNTSDQSLFPMDSAFKRRWDWEYVAISYNEPKSSAFRINVGEGYNWVDFIKQVNERILSLTQSEDKELGNFFIKDSIDADQFKSKVMFYLWYEVLRDEVENSKYFFYYTTTDETGKENNHKFTFQDLYGDNANTILEGFLKYITKKAE